MSNEKCAVCGCMVPPDATKCPKCGNTFSDVRPKTKIQGDGIIMGRTGYSITCTIHGRIHITAKFTSEPTRCPFC